MSHKISIAKQDTNGSEFCSISYADVDVIENVPPSSTSHTSVVVT